MNIKNQINKYIKLLAWAESSHNSELVKKYNKKLDNLYKGLNKE